MESFIVFAIACGVFIVGEIGYLIYHMFVKRREQDAVFQNIEAGKITRFSVDEMNFIKQEAKRHTGSFAIDDITWHDLSMDEVFMQMNYCLSSAGDQKLYGTLRNPALQKEVVEQRVQLMQALSNQEEGNKLRSVLYRVGGQCDTPIDALFRLPSSQVHCSAILAITLLSIEACLLCYSFFHPELFGLLLLTGIVNYAYAANKRSSHAEAFRCATQLIRYSRALHTISRGSYADVLKQYYPIASIMEGLGKVRVSWLDDVMSGDGFFLAMAQNVFLLEILLYARVSKTLLQCKAEILQAVAILGEIDMLLAVMQFQIKKEQCCKVEFMDEHAIYAEDMIHPLVTNCIPNQVCLSQNMLISGSNASGKSTYLKMIAINAIFAQTFGFALAKTYQGHMFAIYTSMALQDSLAQKDSYFVAEVRSIKRILDHLEEGYPLLCMIDEILRGTNTGERIAASSEVLMCFHNKSAICIAATHDVELTHILANHYQNVHFAEEFNQDSMQFNYQLQEGPSNSQNAIKLLAALGFDEDTIAMASQQRAYVREHGTWRKEDGVNYGA